MQDSIPTYTKTCSIPNYTETYSYQQDIWPLSECALWVKFVLQSQLAKNHNEVNKPSIMGDKLDSNQPRKAINNSTENRTWNFMVTKSVDRSS